MRLGELTQRYLEHQHQVLCSVESSSVPLLDAAGVHRIRVALRRSRSIISLLEPHLPKEAQEVRKKLGRTAKLLDSSRENTTQRALMESLDQGHQDLPLPFGDALLWLKRTELTPLSKTSVKILDDGRDSLGELLDWVYGKTALAGPMGWPIEWALPPLLKSLYSNWAKPADALHPQLPDKYFHRTRIRGKEFRYGLEFATPALPEAWLKLHADLILIQDNFGEFQDLCGLIETLKSARQPRFRPLIDWLEIQHAKSKLSLAGYPHRKFKRRFKRLYASLERDALNRARVP